LKEKNFKKEQLIQLLFAATIVLLSVILSPGTSQDDRVTIFGFKTPVLCLHRLIFNEPCAGCGLTRSFVSFAHGDVEASYKFHRLGIPLFIVILFQIPLRLYLMKVGINGYTSFMRKLVWVPGVICMIALFINWIIFIFQTSFKP
jgi:hypothetical protein